MRHSYKAMYRDVLIRPLEKDDIEILRIWRNDQSQTKFLRKIGSITSAMQSEWYMNYLDDDTQIIFAIDEKSELNRMVGSLALYNIDFQNSSAEIGRIQIGDKEAHGRGIGRISLVMGMKIAIKRLRITKIVGNVSPDNIQAYSNDMKIGFQIVGSHYTSSGILENEIELTESDLIRANEYYEQIDLLEA